MVLYVKSSLEPIAEHKRAGVQIPIDLKSRYLTYRPPGQSYEDEKIIFSFLQRTLGNHDALILGGVIYRI